MRSPRRLACLLLVLFAGAARAQDGWGYPNDSLQADLDRWRGNPSVRIDSIGASVQGRAIWMVTISDSTDSMASVAGRTGPKRRIMVHARTHPAEVQATYVAREMVRFLLDSTEDSRVLRRDFLTHLVLQYNPDGVALGNARTNANGVDIESNWDKSVLEPEPAALQRLFQGFMAGPIPVEVALNLHSDQYNGTRFFFYHVEAGTSWLYTELEKAYIGLVRASFPGGIENWDFITSWATGTALRYPEGYWWSHHREAVLALTFEDDNSTGATKFDSTARALLLGSALYLHGHPLSVARDRSVPARIATVRDGVRLRVESASRWSVCDLQGRQLAQGQVGAGETLLPWRLLAPGAMRILSVEEPGRPPQRLVLSLLAR